MDVVVERLGLRPRMNKVACPHHADATPSLHLYADHGYCFSCGWSGDAAGVLAAYTGRDVRDVLRQWAVDKADFTLRERPRQKLIDMVRDRRRRFFEELKAAHVEEPEWLWLQAIEFWHYGWEDVWGVVTDEEVPMHVAAGVYDEWCAELDASPLIGV